MVRDEWLSKNDDKCRRAVVPVGYQFHLGQSVVEKGNQMGIGKQGDYPSMAAMRKGRKKERLFSRRKGNNSLKMDISGVRRIRSRYL